MDNKERSVKELEQSMAKTGLTLHTGTATTSLERLLRLEVLEAVPAWIKKKGYIPEGSTNNGTFSLLVYPRHSG